MASEPIYEFYAELENYHPKIWRRFQVAGNVSMARLGYILMTLFEMKASHLFRLEVPAEENFRTFVRERLGEKEYNRMIEEEGSINSSEEKYLFEIITEYTFEFREEHEKVYDAVQTKLKHIISYPHSKLYFFYDFGDNWCVSVTLERVFKDANIPGRLLPLVLDGAGFGIIEDCGGVWGLTELAKAFKKKKGKAYDEYREWLGQDDLDLESFDIYDMNFRLKRVPRIYSDVYQYELEPTKRSMDILERRYLRSKTVP